MKKQATGQPVLTTSVTDQDQPDTDTVRHDRLATAKENPQAHDFAGKKCVSSSPAAAADGHYKQGHRRLALPLVILLDLMLTGAGLVTFALFHHVLPQDSMASGRSVYQTLEPSVVPEDTLSSLETTVLSSTTTTATKPGTQATESTRPETTAHEPDPDSWQSRFAGAFTDGRIIQSDKEYRSANLAITIERRKQDDAVYYIADIYLSNIEQLRTAFASETYGRGRTDEVLNMALASKAILAISGDYYGIRDVGIVVRNGELYRDLPYDDILILYADGRMETKAANTYKAEELFRDSVWQVWSFGPMLLDQGNPMTTFNSRVNPDNPRCAIGYYEPGHYCFVLVDGRQSGYSNGMTLTELSRLFADLKCQAAYNLDGGESAMMTFFDQVVNQPYDGGRKISDIVYLTEWTQTGH